jgi:hypothetical protein
MRFLKMFVVSGDESQDSFRPIPALLMFLLILTFVGTSIYVLAASA